jgi:hypothetical protein
MADGLLSRRNSGDPIPARRWRLLAVPAALFAALFTVTATAGAGVLDQSQATVSNTAVFVSDAHFVAQTFTDGVSGRLDQLDLAVTRPGAIVIVPLTVEIRTVSGGVPSNVVIGGATVPAASVPQGFPAGFFSVPLSPSVPVSAGVQYAIVLRSASCGFSNCYLWGLGIGTNPYPAGLALGSVPGGPWTPPIANTDFAFKTYVATAPTTKAQCKKGGWRSFTNPSFKNQGRCIAYVNHHNGKGNDDAGHSGKKKGKGKKQ